MAFRSATLPVRTKTKTKTKPKEPVASPSTLITKSKGRTLGQEKPKPSRRESIPDPLSDSEDDDPDFGRAAKEQARNSGDELKEKEAKKRRLKEEKEKREYAKKHGLEYKAPPRPRVKKKKKVKEEEPMREVRRPSPRFRKLVIDESSDSDGNKKVMRATYNPEDRKREVAERTGLQIAVLGDKGKGKAKAMVYSSDDNDSSQAQESEDEGYLKGSRKGKGGRPRYPNTPEGEAKEIADHLKRRWVDSKNPERMSAYRKRMEELYNPLVKLLNVQITIVDSDGEEMIEGSDEDRPTRRRLRSESEDDDVSTPPPPPRKRPHLLDKLPRRITDDSSDEDVKPVITPDQDVKPVLRALPSLTLSDDEPEPTTEEDESPSMHLSRRSSPQDVKPVIPPPSPPSLLQSSVSGLPQDVEMRSAESDEQEPDTEPEETPPVRHSNADSKALVTALHLVNDEDSAPDPDTDDGDEEASDEDGMMKDLQAKARQELEVKTEAERLRIKQENDECLRREMQEERERKEQADSDVEDMEDDEEELSITDATLRAASQAIPREGVLVTKGRPKFRMFTQEQIDTGPLRLAKNFEVPATINRFLRPYQRQGVEFLFHQFRNEIGGVLGDDMGLGKTIQVISFLSAVMHKTGRKQDSGQRARKISEVPDDQELPAPSEHGITCLIVCPASVVHNWEREFKTWSYLDVVVYGGKDKKDELRKFTLGNKDVVIAGYETVRGQIDILSQQDFTMVIVDEVHRLKNPKSAVTKALQCFPTKLRYGLTGTAIQNRLEELWCILNWAVPGKVGTLRQWKDLVSKPLKFLQKANADEGALALGRTRSIALVSNLMPNFWLRRTKESVKLQLPRKIDNVVLCPLTRTQKEVYKNIMMLEEVQLLLTADDPCPCGALDAKGLPFKRGKCCAPGWAELIFQYMDLFRKISNHLALIYSDKEDKARNPKKYEQDLAWVQAAFPDDWHQRKIAGAENDYDPELCGKWTILCELLEVWKAQGDKVLLFSNSLKVLTLLEKLLDTKEFNAVRLDGSVANEDRMELVDAFNDPEGKIDVFLISTRAGGVGLNLTAANRVVIFDPNWNPSHDLQAMDRSYRFGQTREVHVYRLVGAGTIEELIFNRQQNKRALANIAYDANAERRLFSGVEGEGKAHEGELYGVKNIFKYTEGWSLTEKAIRGCGLADVDYEAVEDVGDDEASQRFTEVDGKEIVKDLVDVGVDPRQLDQNAAKQRAAQDAIKRILSGAVTVDSNQTLGNSKAEELLTRQAIQAQQANRAESRETRDNPPPAPKLPIVEAKAPRVEGWDPLQARRKRKASASSDIKVKVEPVVKREASLSPIKRQHPPAIVAKREPKPRVKEEPMPFVKQEPPSSPSSAVRYVDNMPFFTELKDRVGLPADLSRADFFAGTETTGNPRLYIMFSRRLKEMNEREQKKALIELAKEYKRLHPQS